MVSMISVALMVSMSTVPLNSSKCFKYFKYFKVSNFINYLLSHKYRYVCLTSLVVKMKFNEIDMLLKLIFFFAFIVLSGVF